MKKALFPFLLLFSINQSNSQCVNTCINTTNNFTTVHCESFELPPSSISNLTSFLGWFNLDDNNGFFDGIGNNSNSSIKMCNFGGTDIASSEVVLEHPYPSNVNEVIISFDILVSPNIFGAIRIKIQEAYYGNGLKNMKDRIKKLGGNLDIIVKEGTTLLAIIDINKLKSV